MQSSLVSNIDELLEIFSYFIATLFAFYVIVSFVQTIFRRGPIIAVLRLFSFQVILPFLLTLTIFLANLAVVFIEPTNVGVVVSVISPNGIRATPLTSGFHLVVPLVEEVIEYPVFWQTYTMSSTFEEGDVYGDDSIRARTKDGQQINLDISVIFRIDTNQVIQIHILWQDRYVEDLVRPLLSGLVRQQVSQFGVNEVNSENRIDLEIAIETLLITEFQEKGLVLDQFLLRDINYSEEYSESVEQKQVAKEREEEARSLGIAAENRARGEAQATIIAAQAEAEALREVGAALNENPSLLVYTYIERLSPAIRALLVPNDNPFILPLPDDLLQQADELAGSANGDDETDAGSTDDATRPDETNTPATSSGDR